MLSLAAILLCQTSTLLCIITSSCISCLIKEMLFWQLPVIYATENLWMWSTAKYEFWYDLKIFDIVIKKVTKVHEIFFFWNERCFIWSFGSQQIQNIAQNLTVTKLRVPNNIFTWLILCMLNIYQHYY